MGETVDRKKEYKKPEFTELGSVIDVTQTGLTNPGDDGKAGSRPSQGG